MEFLEIDLLLTYLILLLLLLLLQFLVSWRTDWVHHLQQSSMTVNLVLSADILCTCFIIYVWAPLFSVVAETAQHTAVKKAHSNR